ncbi:MAG: hypothetical protein JWP57_4680 [Spirosoma sp.]|nr:hypothetical protein [Spirosoma sp.]
MAAGEFDRRKTLGTAAETALCNLLTSYGATVVCHQHNHDAVAGYPGAAIAHAAGGTLHLPDLSVIWPQRGMLRSYGIEVKTKTPLSNGGGWGWDIPAFDRAVAWATLTGNAVFYAIRDRSVVPLPPAGVLDDADCWHVASIWKLLHSPRSTMGRYHYWSADVFAPLVLLLAGEGINTTVVPYISMDGGRPPLLL